MRRFSYVRSEFIRSDYVTLDVRIIQDKRLSLEGKGYYGGLCAEAVDLKDVPDNIIKELIEVGYLREENNLGDTPQDMRRNEQLRA